ncbi:MAG: hypothetical protein KDB05_10555 [Planctomycetales bacterium]|nr:hypothetical protein [Planctomycetales bacterium]
MFRKLLIASLIGAACSQAFASEEELQAKIQQLEARVAELEKAVEPFLREQRVAEIREQARARMRKDLEVYSQEQLQAIEQLYQVANQNWRSEEGKASLKKLIDSYDKANRTGCALLYLGQMSEGDEQVQYLTRAIEEFSDCCYGDGVQVGAYARFVLAQRHRADGETDKANKLVDEVRRKYAHAIDHRGQPLLASDEN